MGNSCACIRHSNETSCREGTSIAEQIKRSERHWSGSVKSSCGSVEEEMADNSKETSCREGTSIAEQIKRSERHWSGSVKSGCSSVEEEMADNSKETSCREGTSIAEQIKRSERHWSGSVKSGCGSVEEEMADNSKETSCREGTSIAEQIKRSERHWSESVKSDCGSVEGEMADNRKVFKALQSHPKWGFFFRTFGGDELSVGQKFAEGGQAELFHAKVTWSDPVYNEKMLKRGREYVLKVFKKGTSLRQLQSQWPKGYLQYRAEKILFSTIMGPNFPLGLRHYCDVRFGTLLEDGRFAFLMVKETEDLRSTIERNMSSMGEGNHGPFPKEKAEVIMFKVALGMEWLCGRNILHRDLKASNVLYSHNHEEWSCYVADFECSVGVVGTGFFRAPEILQAIKDRVLGQKPGLFSTIKDRVLGQKSDVFSTEADVYSYGMTCYEILTGKLPFEGHPISDYDIVLKDGRRPEVPEYVDDWVHDLLTRCWQEDPRARPSFREIVLFLSDSSDAIRMYESKLGGGHLEEMYLRRHAKGAIAGSAWWNPNRK